MLDHLGRRCNGYQLLDILFQPQDRHTLGMEPGDQRDHH